MATIRPNAEPAATTVAAGDIFLIDGPTGVRALAASSAFDAVAPTTTRGDIIARGASGNQRVALGTSGYLLGSNGTDTVFQGYSQGGAGAATRTWATRLQDTVSILDFGAVADASTAYSATNATTNATAMNAALAIGKNVLIPYNVNGYSFIGNTVVLGTGQSIVGENQVLLKCQVATSGWFIHVTAFEILTAPAIIRNVAIDMTGAGTTSTAIRFATASGVVSGVQLSQLVFTNCVEAIGDETSASNYDVDIKIYDIRCIKTLGRQVYLRRTRGFIWIDTMRIDHTQNSGAVTWEGARFEDFIGLEINRFDVVGPVGTTYQSTATGLVLNGVVNGTSAWLNRILVDSSTGNGILINAVTNLFADSLFAFGNLGFPIQFTTVLNANISNTLAAGGFGLTGAVASENNIVCGPCTNVNFNGVFTSGATGHGISIAGASSGVSVLGIQSINNAGFGIVLASTADNIIIDGGSVSGNTGGAVFNASSGTHNRVQNITGFNPVGVTAAAAAGTSPFTVTANISPETHYLKQTATNTATVAKGGQQVAALVNASTYYPIHLGPNESYVITWATTAPTITKDVH